MSLSRPSLSVVIPVHDAAPLIAQAAGVLARSTRPAEEVVFVDDGSTDGTGAALDAATPLLEAAGTRVCRVTHAANRGRGAARQSGLEAVTTRHLAWLDIDDLYGPDRIGRLVAALERTEAEDPGGPWILSTPFRLCQARQVARGLGRPGQAVAARAVPDLGALFAGTAPRTLQLQSLAGPTAAFRAAGFDPGLNWAEDFDFLLRFLGGGGRVIAAPEGAELPRAEDVVYFQSFRTPRALVDGANAAVFDRHRELLARHGIDAGAALEEKRAGYIALFPPGEAGQGAAGQGAAGDGEAGEAATPILEGPAPDGVRAEGDRVLLSDTGPDGETDGETVRSDFAPADPVGDGTGDGTPPGPQTTRADLALAWLGGAALLRRTRPLAGGGAAIDGLRLRRGEDGLFGLLGGDTVLRRSARIGAAALAPWRDGSGRPGLFRPTHSRLDDPGTPLIVSFFGGDPSYRRQADRLAGQLDRLGADYQICAFEPEGAMDWTRLCRKKISYYVAQSQRHGRPLFWIDVDTQLLGDPRGLMGAGDVGAFLRNFSALPGFDPMRFARLLHPGYLGFGTGPRARAFLAHLRAVDATAPDSATDDWVLQEALLTHEGALSFTLFAPSAVVTSNEAAPGPDTVFRHGDSGHVAAARATAAQHVAGALGAERQVRVLWEAAEDAIAKGEIRDAAAFCKRIRRVDPGHEAALVRLLRAYLDLGEAGKYRFHRDKAGADPALRPAVLKVELDRLYREGDHEGAAAVGAELGATGDAAARAFAESRAFRHGFDLRARAAGVDEAARTAMMWWEMPHPGNLGDIVGPYIVEAMTGIPPRYSKASPRMVSVGSIIRFARAGDVVWGAGAAAASQAPARRAEFRAVRGPLTRALVREAGGSCPEIYGDPAWFLPLIRPCRDVARTHRLGLIRHFTHADRPLEVAPDVREIDILRGSVAGIEAFLDEMNSCEAILSTSLHGVIIAQAYGIPVAWAVDSDAARQIHGDGMKFADYAQSVGVAEGWTPFDLSSVPRIDAGLARVCTHAPARPIDLRALADAAPFALSAGFRARL